MGKILDTITVLFKGDTSDLARKKKEAEDLASEAAKNIKEIQTSTTATNATLETTNKTLTQTENITDNIGQGIAAWVVAAHEASASINDAIGAEKAHREQVRIEKGLASTQKGALSVENALKGVVKQFTTAAIGAFSVGKAVENFKNVVSGTLDLQRASESLGLDPATIDAYGRAAESAGGSFEDFNEVLERTRDANGGVTGTPLLRFVQAQLKALHDAESNAAAQGLNATSLHFPQSIVRAAREGLFSEENLARIRSIAPGIDEATKKVDLLSKAWSDFRTNIRGTSIDLENNILGPLTKLIDLFNTIHEGGPKLTNQLKTELNPINIITAAYNNITGTPTPTPTQANFPLTNGGTRSSNSTSIRVDNLNVQAPKGVDPTEWATTMREALEYLREKSDLIQNYNGPLVG